MRQPRRLLPGGRRPLRARAALLRERRAVRRHAGRDGFFVERTDGVTSVLGRFRGADYRLRIDGARASVGPGFELESLADDPATELRFLSELRARGVDFMLVGASAALLQGAPIATQDIDLWFARLDDPRIGEAARAVGGLWVSGSFGMRPPGLGGALGDRFDVVTHMHGLRSFDEELANTSEVDLDGVPVRVLLLERIVASKRATGRPEDLAQIPALEAALAARDEPDRR